MSEVLTMEKLADEVRHLFGQVVLIHDAELAMLIGVGRDVMDFYYIAHSLRRRSNVDGPTWYSAVGHCVGLKERLDPYDYARLENTYRLNFALPDSFQVLADLGKRAFETWDPDRHPALFELMHKDAYDAAVARAQAADGDVPGS